ncbi:hypothetical protein TWF106_008880 [Orbilia oligospora]|uniref:GCS light chain n=1 Tax=Orbilia oligospora TaxID=2813651 RepID=A0A6G1LWK3_ORBOL|nr:hypothetical protein TWF788_001048 [Orbilia oligospora]KAF3203083.1 hypothetical protein TWF679_010546 [Orbilia oligospora]KAF3207034.1 hypothetical protein TWF191_001141 [Orbilia oligospora]KAF3215039.1 hypothetical protein TWF106_008880 [Orbilia oligospora]KAF3235810.1 hypothetical protein TWF192_000626 [Orbilia oligospora]
MSPPSLVVFRTGNIITTGRTSLEKSNQELLNSLRQNFEDAASRATGEQLSWIEVKGDTFYAPGIEEPDGLSEERSEYDITVKLFYLPGVFVSKRKDHTREALQNVFRELRVSSIDLLIISFPNISFDAEDHSPDTEPTQEEVDEWAETYQTLETLQLEGQIKRIGLSEFGVARLLKLLPRTSIKPSVDQINVRDCCVVPKPLIQFAREQRIELLTHNDCTNILPSSALQGLLQENHLAFGDFKNVDPQWVVKYTAVIQDRGVVENKGYFAMAKVDIDRT